MLGYVSPGSTSKAYSVSLNVDGYDTHLTTELSSILPYGFVKSVCSTLNPFSSQNIIGDLHEYHDMLNKIYPYDRQTSFSLWFNDSDGNRCVNKYITGYLDLELIIDNTNNLNLDV